MSGIQRYAQNEVEPSLLIGKRLIKKPSLFIVKYTEKLYIY